MKILILKPSSLGDVVQAMPVLRLIKKQIPESQVYWWIEAGLAGLLDGDPDLEGVVIFHRKRWGNPFRWGEVWKSVRWMRAQNFDWVIDLQCLARSASFSWLANGKLTVGLDEPREGARGFYDVVARRASYYTHAVDWYLSVLPLLGLRKTTDFTWIPERPDIAAAVRRRWSLHNGQRWIVLQPGARWSSKRWPPEYYEILVDQLAADYPAHSFAVLGGADDYEVSDRLARRRPLRTLNLAGQLSLQEMIEWIRMAEVMISNDTGPMHVAAALQRPVLALFGPTEPRRTGPYGQIPSVLQSRLECVPCMRAHCRRHNPIECLHLLGPDQVRRAIRDRLGETLSP